MSRGSESIKELRKICQESRYENEGGMPWFERNFYRRFSIYFTKVFLKTGMSANQVTVIGALIGLIAGLFLAFANPLYWIIGVLFFYLVLIFDRVDGEVARYKNLASPGGAYLDSIAGIWISPYRLACMSFGVYNALHDIAVFIFGFLAAISVSISFISLYGHNTEFPAESPSKTAKSKSGKTSKVGTLFRYGQFIFNNDLMFLTVILITAIIDMFIPVITISCIPFTGSFGVNARYAFLIAYGVGVLTAIIIRVHHTVRENVRPSL